MLRKRGGIFRVCAGSITPLKPLRIPILISYPLWDAFATILVADPDLAYAILPSLSVGPLCTVLTNIRLSEDPVNADRAVSVTHCERCHIRKLFSLVLLSAVFWADDLVLI